MKYDPKNNGDLAKEYQSIELTTTKSISLRMSDATIRGPNHVPNLETHYQLTYSSYQS